MRDLSKAEKLLLAAGRLAAEGRADFTAEDLVVRAFKDFGRDFSLKGYPEYPDSNSVLTHVMGKKARLIVSGWVEKVGTKQYRLAAKGLHDAASLEDGDQSDLTRMRIERPLEDGLGRLITSSVYDSFKSGRESEITFHQFCRFAGLSARDKWQKVSGKLQSLDYIVEHARRLGEAGETVAVHFRDRNYTLSPEELRNLGALHRFLEERFRNEMEEWKRNAFSQ